MSEHLCDVCDLKPVASVLCSPFGAMSNGYCIECAIAMAEPEWSFHYLWDCVADSDRTKLIPETSTYLTFKDGRYWTWDEWADWRTYEWFVPNYMFHFWAFKPYGPLEPPPEEEHDPTIPPDDFDNPFSTSPTP